MNDYDMLSIATINTDLWQNEISIVKTKEEKLAAKYMYNYPFYDCVYSIWEKQWKLDWTKTDTIKPAKSSIRIKRAKIANVDAFIYLDYYNYNGKYEISTNAVFDYSMCYLPFKQQTREMKRLIEEYFENVHIIAKNLELLLNSCARISPKRITKEYRKASKRVRQEKKEFIKKQKAYLRVWLLENEYGAKKSDK